MTDTNDETRRDLLVKRIKSLEGRIAKLEKQHYEMNEDLSIFRRLALEADRTRPIYIEGRKTPVRKFIDFDKGEMKFINDVLSKMIAFDQFRTGGEGDRAHSICERFDKILSDWEDEAHQNGEFF